MFMRGLELLRNDRGVFVASPSQDYQACWIRDQLYSTFAYFYTGETKKFTEGVQIVFDILHKSRLRIESAIYRTPTVGHEFIHAKYHHESLDEITNDWGHHQIDAIGLFLYAVGFSYTNKIAVFRTAEDLELIQLLVQYLISIRYWESRDNGMWEEGMELHASSLGAAVCALESLSFQKLAAVPQEAIDLGREALFTLLPNETVSRTEDMAQLSLMWPYNIIPREIQDSILKRIMDRLVQSKGLNRYWGDTYYRSENGISGEWTMGFFWLSIVYSERGDPARAKYWYERGLKTVTKDGHVPELYQNGEPNVNTPLGWAHALAIIAEKKIAVAGDYRGK
ncbi:MAG: phosphorylase kinase alpha/beta subunit [Parcubacteria group bacterium Gr01-1014_48]|nr:MAG: phosphorylase kinase alpha/beta subunit [Parcubacteria group bacterium Greene0416_14]TSC73623.1 MAG: phosphorylase kinase alpha/beta subunit [Parcubacteria group bacterium Gr01-1014_48]TSD00901.1 MAG: phosphorylase kinase alpha/beta subunit [Parcubacteria group bacterium Greene1014_15]TSD07983.1 MAG: phosphorylase kinase alpha/beta subunit [Parcubacteria group bacterium Greene0714_4]